MGKKGKDSVDSIEDLKNKQKDFNASMGDTVIALGPENGSETEEPDTTEQALAKGVHKLTHHGTDTVKLMSELSPKKRSACAICITKAKVFDNDVVDKYIDEYFRVGVSLDRKGRKEIVHVVSTVKQEETRRGILARIKGFVGNQPM